MLLLRRGSSADMLSQFNSRLTHRPGLLDRGAKTRGMEKPLLSIMPGMSVKVSGVADLMLKAGLVSVAGM
jgi:hypothetical protein